MKLSNVIRLVVFSSILSLATIAHADQHLCPTLNDIQSTIKDSKLLHVEDYYLGGKYSFLTYFGSFNTNETWYLCYRSIDSDAKSDADAWKIFQRRLKTIPNSSQYAEDEIYSWDCKYTDDYTQTYLIARLMSP